MFKPNKNLAAFSETTQITAKKCSILTESQKANQITPFPTSMSNTASLLKSLLTSNDQPQPDINKEKPSEKTNFSLLLVPLDRPPAGVDIKKSAKPTNKSGAPPPQLPKANINILDDLPICYSEYQLPPNHIKFMEKTSEELDEEVEYDMDEEDNVWLKLINEERTKQLNNQGHQLNEVTQEQFELLMDRLEKECHFQQSTAAAVSAQTNTSPNTSNNSSRTTNDTTSEDALCCICLDGECVNSNEILFCDMCNLAVHQECYGVPYIPEGQWLCRRCIQSPSTPVDCLLCPNGHGAFKQTDRGKWVHMVCAIWIPEVHFANPVFLDPIVGIENIDKARWKLTCYICRKKGNGACIQCEKQNCYTAFHVTCAQSAGLYMSIKEEIIEVENDKKRKSRGAGSNQNNSSTIAEVKKSAFCDIHTPLEALSQRTRDQLGIGRNGSYSVINHAECEEALRRAQKQRMRRARKILAEKRNLPPTICLPVLPKEKVNEIMNKIEDEELDGKAEFFAKLMNYWLLKRYSRNGVPLLRRLQHSASLKKNIQYQANSRKNEEANESSAVDQAKSAASLSKNSIQEQLSYWKKLRQDLERARLLMELIRKRERIKRDMIRLHELTTSYEINPFNGVFLQRILDLLIESDKNEFFYEPVDREAYPSYYEDIKEPMCFKEMQAKLKNLKYKQLDEFESDLNLIVSNCLQFNLKNSVYYKAALKLKDTAGGLFKKAREIYSTCFDEPSSGFISQLDKMDVEMSDAAQNENNATLTN